MATKLTITWGSIEDKMSNDAFVKERLDKMLLMKSQDKIVGTPDKRADSITASVTWTTLADAEEWKTFIEALATKYGKTISSIVIEEV